MSRHRMQKSNPDRIDSVTRIARRFQIVSPFVFEDFEILMLFRYSKKLANDALAKNQNFRWCTCGKGQIHGPGGTSRSIVGTS